MLVVISSNPHLIAYVTLNMANPKEIKEMFAIFRVIISIQNPTLVACISHIPIYYINDDVLA